MLGFLQVAKEFVNQGMLMNQGIMYLPPIHAPLRPDQPRMRVDESRNSRSRLTANSHALSSTLSWFKF